MSSFVSGSAQRLTGRRLAITLLVCFAIAVIVATLSALTGIVMGRDGRQVQFLEVAGIWDSSSPDHKVLWLRLPRVFASLLVGGALAGAGCALQALLRNPLAEPFTLGISSGSSLAAVIGIRIGIEGTLGDIGVSAAALFGAVGTLLVVWRLARIGSQLPAATLVLAGVTVSMWCSATSLLIQYTSDFSDVSHMLRWMMGSLDSMRLSSVEYALLPIFAGIAVLVAFARELDALAAGPEAAASVGVSVARTQIVVFAVASLLVGAAIALAGPIGFIGLIVPHALRAMLGPSHRLLVPASVLGGAVLLVLCDAIARMAIAPAELPTGAVTAVLGGPFFVAILIGQKRKAAMWGRG
jgi:iron complex transport system permease protein